MGYLFILRYAFVNSIEGAYYERQLTKEASHITRWRDAIDNWVLRQFVSESGLDQRFLVRGDVSEREDGEEQHRTTER
jgi:hypothetical protein